jgi:uncharacterized protein
MRFVVDVLHPIDSHIFHYFIDELRSRGHDFLITSRRKDCAVELLEAFDIPQHVLTSRAQGLVGKLGELAVRTKKLLKLAKQFDPDYMISMTGPVVAAASPFLRAKTLVLHDNEIPRMVNRGIACLSDTYAVPRGFTDECGSSQVRYDGYQQLAYLHPNHFKPDIEVVRRHGLISDEPLYIVRFVEMDAYHDVGERGFSYQAKSELIRRFAAKGRVVITSEERLPEEFQKYQLAVPVEDIHHVMAYADLLIGESCTMGSEAGVLGTHAFWIARTWRGVVNDMSERYGLIHHFSDDQAREAMDRAEKLLAHPNLKADGRDRADRLLSENVDLTQWMIDYIEQDSGMKL